jgi:hypothetical protein
MANLLCASPTPLEAKPVVISDDWEFALYKPGGGSHAMVLL